VPDFEVFTRRMIPLVKQPTVMLQKRGTMSFNKAAHVAMGSPEAVELLYDRAQKVIGIRPVAPELEHAYPMRPQAKGRWAVHRIRRRIHEVLRNQYRRGTTLDGRDRGRHPSNRPECRRGGECHSLPVLTLPPRYHRSLFMVMIPCAARA
jgi:hypothetical protein